MSVTHLVIYIQQVLYTESRAKLGGVWKSSQLILFMVHLSLHHHVVCHVEEIRLRQSGVKIWPPLLSATERLYEGSPEDETTQSHGSSSRLVLFPRDRHTLCTRTSLSQLVPEYIYSVTQNCLLKLLNNFLQETWWSTGCLRGWESLILPSRISWLKVKQHE